MHFAVFVALLLPPSVGEWMAVFGDLVGVWFVEQLLAFRLCKVAIQFM